MLGPLEVRLSGEVLHVRPRKQRAILAVLLLHANRVVSVDELADALWGSAPPPSARVTVQNYVKRLRDALGIAGHTRIVTKPTGYQICVSADELDLCRCESHLMTASTAVRSANWSQAAESAREALALWRGDPLSDVESTVLASEVPRLTEMRLRAAEIYAEASLHLGRDADIIGELQELVAAAPLRERFHALLMLALHGAGRQADALAAYQHARSVLVKEVGTEPGAELRELHQRILADDADLVRAQQTWAAAGAHPRMRPRELPAPIRHFIGRGEEIAALTGILEEDIPAGQETVIISAIGGTAGVGKTALAVRWAHHIAGRFPDGHLYVNLRGYDHDQPVSASDALAAFLRSLGVPGPEIPDQAEERAARFRSMLAGQRVLVVLDNARDLDQLRLLLPGSAGCLAVVTSRDSLAGLVARDGARRLDLDLLSPTDSVELLHVLIGARVEREPEAAGMLAARCARLPLALRIAAELAAARPEAALAELVGELTDQQRRLDVLDADGDRRTAVRSVFSWSYDKLEPDTARAFRLCGLHPGPDLDAHAVAALTGSPADHAARMLGHLIRAHLIQATGPGRYAMHDLLRSYAREVAALEDGRQECQACVTRLFDYYLYTASAAMDQVSPNDRDWRPALPERAVSTRPISDRQAALCWLDAELPALCSVTASAAEQGWPQHAVWLASVISTYLTHGAHIVESAGIYRNALAAAMRIGDRRGEARALAGLGTAALQGGRYAAAREHYQQALAVFRQLGHWDGEFRVMMNLGGIDLAVGQPTLAEDSFTRALELSRQAGTPAHQARALSNLSAVDMLLCRWPRAVKHLQTALALICEIGDDASQAMIRNNLGYVYLQQCRYKQAEQELRQSLRLARASGYRQVETDSLTNLGQAALGQDDIDAARTYLEQALQQAREASDPSAESKALVGLGEALLASGQPGAARSKHAAALALSQRTEKYEQARAHDGLARACYAAGHHDEARQHWELALDLYAGTASPKARQVRAQLSRLTDSS